MGDFKDKNGKTRIGLFLKNLTKHVPNILDTVGELTGIQALEKAGELLGSQTGLSDADRQALMAQLGHETELELARLQDMANARQREIELARAGKSDIMQKVVGGAVLLLVVFCVVMVLCFDLKNENLAHLILGEVLTLAGGMVGYYYGSSKSSQEKTKMLEQWQARK